MGKEAIGVRIYGKFEDIIREPFRRFRPLLEKETDILKKEIPDLKKLLKRLEEGERPKIAEVRGVYHIFPDEKIIKTEINLKEERLEKLKRRLSEMI